MARGAKAKAVPIVDSPSKMTDGRTTIYLVEALLALSKLTPDNRERAALRLRDVALAVASGASPNVVAVSQLLSDLVPDEDG